ENIKVTHPENITSIYENIVASIKRKEEFGHIPYEVINEFFVMEKEFISLENYKKIERTLAKNRYIKPSKSKYSYQYWTKLSQYNIPKFNVGLHDILGIQLIEIK